MIDLRLAVLGPASRALVAAGVLAVLAGALVLRTGGRPAPVTCGTGAPVPARVVALEELPVDTASLSLPHVCAAAIADDVTPWSDGRGGTFVLAKVIAFAGPRARLCVVNGDRVGVLELVADEASTQGLALGTPVLAHLAAGDLAMCTVDPHASLYYLECSARAQREMLRW